MKASSNLSLSLPVFVFRGGGWQGFAALPQPALLQGLSGPRPPADHQRQPLPPHSSLWVHNTTPLSLLPPSFHCLSLSFLDIVFAFLLLLLRLYFVLFLCFSFPSLPPGRCPCVFFITHMLFLSVSRRLSLLLFPQSSGCWALSAWGFHGNHPLVSRLALPWRPTPFSTR